MGWRSILKVGPDIPSYGTDPGVCKGERKAVLSGGAPSTLAGFANFKASGRHAAYTLFPFIQDSLGLTLVLLHVHLSLCFLTTVSHVSKKGIWSCLLALTSS